MSQIEELQQRITAAMDRIGQGLELVAGKGGGADPAETAALREALEEEQLANQQLQERVRNLSERRQVDHAAAEKAESDLKAALSRFDGELQALRKANQLLRDNNQALREANEEIGLDGTKILQLGQLDEAETPSGFRITPCVGAVPFPLESYRSRDLRWEDGCSKEIAVYCENLARDHLPRSH